MHSGGQQQATPFPDESSKPILSANYINRCCTTVGKTEGSVLAHYLQHLQTYSRPGALLHIQFERGRTAHKTGANIGGMQNYQLAPQYCLQLHSLSCNSLHKQSTHGNGSYYYQQYVRKRAAEGTPRSSFVGCSAWVYIGRMHTTSKRCGVTGP